MSVFRHFILAVALTASGYATTLYVATTGSDSAAGTSTAPLATLSRALAIVKPGDTISLGAGVFSGDVNTSVAATATNRITIQGAGVGSTIYTGRVTIVTNYYTIKNITFRGNSVLFSAVTGGILENCEAYRGLSNFKISGGSGCIVRNNQFRRAGGNSMGDVSGDGHLIEGNVFSENNGFDVHRTNNAINCTWRGNLYDTIGTPNNNVCSSASSNAVSTGLKTFTVASGLGYETDDFMRIQVSSNSAIYLRGWIVSYSGTTLKVDVSSAVGSGTFASWSIQTEGNGNHGDILQAFTGDNYNCVFEGNRVNNCTAQLGMFEANPNTNSGSIRDWTFRNNVFVNSRIQINIYAAGFKFYNNTVYNTSGTVGFRGATDVTKGDGAPLLVYNNIFCRVGNIESAGPYSGASADYNLITDYPDDSSKTGYSEPHGINGGYTPSQIFVDPANGDFRLRSDSPAIGVGADLATIDGISSTLNANVSVSTWNMGASGTLLLGAGTSVLSAPSNARVTSLQ